MTEEPLNLPTAAWYLTWAFLIDEVLLLVERGPQSAPSIVLSVPFSILLVGWFSYGVLTARPARLVLVWIVLVLSVVADVVGVVDRVTGWSFVHLAASVAQVVFLKQFTASDYFVALRADPNKPRVSLEAIMMIVVVVAALGGVVGTAHDDPQFRITF